MDNSLFNISIKFNDYIKRNIVLIEKPELAFESICDEADISAILAVTDYARQSVSRKNSLENFYYTAAIGYPFQTKPFMMTRYSDGSYPIWYGSNTIETSIYETVYHALRFSKAEEGTFSENKIVKRRSVFDVFCQAFLVDLRTKTKAYPEILGEDYDLTHKIGKEAREGGLPGILSPSARHSEGVNFNIFNEAVLKSPEFLLDLNYDIFPKRGILEVTGLSKTLKLPIPSDFHAGGQPYTQ